ncbi:hypothetical protein RhiirC2_793381 [Rhizophagus irregularis]|uniref:Uncharacterized protein n=1 Tax=Rhizophagus irregularis TaxID=588596 RepID=A0A2N1MFH5_9GLOM|nr:hypothetical protein RhiirC2_793381 [Rhizophagus irregularis]
MEDVKELIFVRPIASTTCTISGIIISNKYENNEKLCYTDTDSIETKDVYVDMIEDADLYDLVIIQKINYLKNYHPAN